MRQTLLTMVAGIPLMLSACAAPPGLPPGVATAADASSAKVRFVAHADGGNISVYPETSCNGGVGILNNSWSREVANKNANYVPPRTAMLDAPYEPADMKVAEYAFVPGRTLNIGVMAPNCVRGLSLALRPGAQYEVVLESECRVVARELTATTGGSVRRDGIRSVGPLLCEGTRP